MSQKVYEAPPVVPVEQAPVTPAPIVDTVVIPEATSQAAGTPQSAVNSFIPDVHMAPTDGGTPPPKSADNPLFRRIAIVGVAVLVLAGIVFGVSTLFAGKAKPKHVTINYWGLWENDAVTRQFIALFERQNPEITVQYTQQSPKQYR